MSIFYLSDFPETYFHSFMHPRPIIPRLDNLVHRQPHLHNLLPVRQVILHGPPVGLGLVLRDPGLDVPHDEPPPRHGKVHIDKPHLVHQPGSRRPRLLVQSDIVPLEHDNPVAREDRDIILLGVLDSVVERRRQDGPRRVGPGLRALGRRRGRGRGRGRDGEGEGLPQGLDELQEGRPVKGELGAAPGVRRRRVRHGRELGPRQVVAVHGDEGGYGGGRVGGVGGVQGRVAPVELCCDDLREGGFA
ncbi:hypothetical protein VM1G_11949 [Cytospora mali]|uniref:Uncharacterized protein n=1 Tax=Cytospora mali TaxID=578113 RepID=A0A194WCE4_CYTMA|nr:hypothetical protein VM1G_11949 [Valsa mali]